MRLELDNSMVQLFLHRDDLMERILAYKMLRGRVEPYLTMKTKIDLKSCLTPQYEVCDSGKGERGFTGRERIPPITYGPKNEKGLCFVLKKLKKKIFIIFFLTEIAKSNPTLT